ncbi:MAG: hypothetical protein KDD42_03310 [Bdellovibrionales bacterium]|nr:hypothetical protein [Bdellovibrionales bacterium]
MRERKIKFALSCLLAAITHLVSVGYAFAACQPEAGTNNYYVDGSNFCGGGCSDSGPGSASSPWCTLNKALESLSAGQTAHIYPGTYDLSVGTGLDSQGNLRPAHSGNVNSPIRIIAHSSAAESIGKPEVFDEASLVFIIGAPLIADKDHWEFSGLFFREGSGFRCEGANHITLKDSLNFTEPRWKKPEIMPELGGGTALTFYQCSNFEIDNVEAYSAVTDTRACSEVIEQRGSNLLVVDQGNDFKIRNSIFYGTRNTQVIQRSNNFSIENTTYFGGQEHLGGITEDSHHWALRDSLILPGPGQEFWIELKPDTGECYREPRISHGKITNNLFFSGPKPKFTTSGFLRCQNNYIGQISDITLRNNLAIHHRWGSTSAFAGSNERDENAIDSDYNLLWDVFPRLSWPGQPNINFWNIFHANSNNQNKLSLVLDDWQTQTTYPQITQDTHSEHHYTRSLEGIDPGFMTRLTQFENFGVENFEGVVPVNPLIPAANCDEPDYATNLAYPYRMNLRMVDFRLRQDSPIRNFVADPNYGNGKVGPYWLYSEATPTPLPTISPTPSATRTPTPTITSTPTPTSTSTPSPTPTTPPREGEEATPTPGAVSTSLPTPIPNITVAPDGGDIEVKLSGRTKSRAGRRLTYRVKAISRNSAPLKLTILNSIEGAQIKTRNRTRKGRATLNATIKVPTQDLSLLNSNPFTLSILVSDGIEGVTTSISTDLIIRVRRVKHRAP